MSFNFSKAQEAELERQALAGGGSIAKSAKCPEPCPEPLETRMSWSEKQFQAEVVKLAKANDWKVYHTYLSVKSEAGFPDLVLVHRGRHGVVYAELKRQKGKESAAQKEWRQALLGAGERCYLWRPADWELIVATLTDPIGS